MNPNKQIYIFKNKTMGKKFTLSFILLTAFIAISTLVPAQDFVEKPVTKMIIQGDVYLQRDVTDILGTVTSNTSDEDFSNNDYILWQQYLSRPNPSVETIHKYFQKAAVEFGVPVEILEAIGQVENNWTQMGPSIDRGWGIMHLVDNDYCKTLNEAAQLINSKTQVLKDDAEQNIRGAAALLAKYAGNNRKKNTQLEDWFDAVKQFSGLISDDLRELQAEEYYKVIRDGNVSTTIWNETITLQKHLDVNIENKLKYKEKSTKTSDYAAAISNFTSYNYTVGRDGVSIDTWVNHWVGTGTYAGAISWFKNSAAQASSHFVIRSSDGQISQCVAVANKAWHCGASGYPLNNSRSIGVEHEATAANPGLWNSTAMLTASANMACYFCNIYGIAKTRTLPGIRGHNEMPGTSTSCPGSMPWTKWMNYLNSCGCNAPAGLSVSLVTASSAKLSWTAATGATSYNIQYKKSSATTWATTTSATAYKTISGLSASTLYQFKVQTNCSGGLSSYSSVATFNTVPVNDNCSSAITLTSGTTCSATSGNLLYATTSGLARATCDVNSGTPALKDVWYKFKATATKHTIKLTPSSGLDGVLALYSSCTGGQKGCKDNGGGAGGVETLYATGLTIGNTYYIRVYSAGPNTPSTTTFTICVTKTTTKQMEWSDEESEDNTDLFTIYPNPAKDEFKMDFYSDVENIITVRLIDLTGRIVFANTYNAMEGMNTFSVNLNDVSKGFYAVEASDGKQKFVQKLVIDK